MARLTDPDYVEAHPGRSTFLGIGFGYVVVITIMILVGITTLILWGTGVLFAPTKGKIQAYQQQQSATNRVFAQQHFETLYGDYTSTVNKLPQAENDVAANSGNQYYQTNLDGLVNICNDTVAQYNQDSQKYLLKDFKTADLPQTLDAASCTPTPPASGGTSQ